MRVPLVTLALIAATTLANESQAQTKKEQKQEARRERVEQRQERREDRREAREDRREERGEHHGGNGAGAPALSVSGFVRNDVNYNGLNEPTDAGLSGWTVTLTGTTSVTVPTNADGSYSFANVAAGTYTVCVASQGGMTPLQPGSGPGCATGKGWTVTVSTSSVTGVDFLFSLVQAG